MTGKKFRVLLAESAPGEAADGLRALYAGPDSTLELSSVSTLPTLVARIERARTEAIFLQLSLGNPDPLELAFLPIGLPQFGFHSIRSRPETPRLYGPKGKFMKKASKSRERLIRRESVLGTENLAQQMPPPFDHFRKPAAGVA